MKKAIFFLFLCLLFSLVKTAPAQKFYQERIYEPVIFTAQQPHFNNVPNMPVNEIFLYAYDEASHTFKMIPFQIDEKILGWDPFSLDTDSPRQRWFYSIPSQWADYDSLKNLKHDGIFNDHDELVFMIKDMGDRAPISHWINNEESKNYNRLELRVSDPDNKENAAYVYLFRSKSISEPVPTPYNIQYTNETRTISTVNYSVSLDESSGVIKDIALLPPLGTGEDIFDSQKIRLIGYIDLGFIAFSVGRGGIPSANERDFLYHYTESDVDYYYMRYTENPVVRTVRETRMAIQMGGFTLHDLSFYVTTKFYPYSGTIDGGVSLDDSTLNAMFPGADDLYMEVDLVRQSWDFNEKAVGMKFYNKYNDGILMDGNPDAVNKNIDIPIKEWTLASGPQGALFTYVTFDDTTWKSKELYYWDNKDGGQGDETVIEAGDTGFDGKSYGDQGIVLKNGKSLELFFTAFFLPGSVGKADGEKLAYHLENEPAYGGNAVAYPVNVRNPNRSAPAHFTLLQNYPNPFNGETQIEFVLTHGSFVTLSIYNTNGREVATLVNSRLTAGRNLVHWDGLNKNKQQVPSGTYLYKLQTEDLSVIKKMILIR